MLHKETVSNATLELLKRLMADERLKDFVLVGGTALSLQMGHRISIDLDLFINSDFDAEALREYLERTCHLETDYMAFATVKGEIEGVQVDCIAHSYPWIRPFVEEEGIRLASMEDICAMKLNAIAGNGTRIKDFVDVAYLSSSFSLRQMLEFYEEKYPPLRWPMGNLLTGKKSRNDSSRWRNPQVKSLIHCKETLHFL